MQADRGVGRWLARRAELGPERIALVFGDRQWTYGQLEAEANAVADGLRGLGVSRGDRVAFLDLNHPNFILTMFATAKLGAIMVPLNFRLTASELRFIIDDSGVHTLIYDEQFGAVVDELRSSLPCRSYICSQDGGRDIPFSRLLEGSPQPHHNDVAEHDVALIMYTSGTTGTPKGAMLTHANLYGAITNLSLAFDTLAQDVTLVVAPLFHIGGINVTTLCAFLKGATVVLERSFDAQRVLDLIAQRRVSTMFGAPTMLLMMSQLPAFADADLSSLRFMICGGAPVPEALVRRYAERGIRVCNGYGMTETAPLITIVPPDRVLDKIGAAGLPGFFTDVRLVDDEDRQVALGERGEIVVRGPSVMKGYWNRPEATAQTIVDGWLHTGDIGVQDEEGYFYVVDRKKDMIISGGENVSPSEVEGCLYDHPDIAEAAVIAVPDPKWGEAVCAVVVAKEGRSLTAEDVIAFTRDRLAHYKQPTSVVFTELLPRSPAGKVLKFELRERFGGDVAGQSVRESFQAETSHRPTASTASTS